MEEGSEAVWAQLSRVTGTDLSFRPVLGRSGHDPFAMSRPPIAVHLLSVPDGTVRAAEQEIKVPALSWPRGCTAAGYPGL